MLILYEINIRTGYFNTTIMRVTTVLGYTHTYFTYGFRTIRLFLDTSIRHLQYEIRNHKSEIRLNEIHTLQSCTKCGKVFRVDGEQRDLQPDKHCCVRFLSHIISTETCRHKSKQKAVLFYDSKARKRCKWYATIIFRKSIRKDRCYIQRIDELMEEHQKNTGDVMTIQQFLFFRNDTQKYFGMMKGVAAIVNAILSGCSFINSKYRFELFWSLRFLYKTKKMSMKSAELLHTQMTQRSYRSYMSMLGVESQQKLHQQLHLYTRIRKFHKLCNFLKTRSQTKKMAFLLSGYYFENRTCVINAPSFFDMDEEIREIVVDDIWVYESYNFPIKVSCNTESRRLNMLYKCGDNLSNDFFMLCVTEYVSYLLKLKTAKYKILLFASRSGVIEMLEAETFSATYRNKTADLNSLSSTQQEVLLKTFAACILVAYLFGVGDRNDDNFLVTSGKCVLQIDYSYILGNDPKPFRNNVVIPRIMQRILRSDELVFEKFMSYYTEYFFKIRGYKDQLLVFFRFVNVHPFSDADIMAVQKYFTAKLHLEQSKNELARTMREEVRKGMTFKLSGLYAMFNVFGKYLRR
ncbi:hypothetical protein VCUG_00109 [Vavraia culicis subsp. floridensis]|uniref:PI3K/PI4K catalytic domain-containing protein n=1 Tax=Vavraia culicis (isolate floridensis) TaxID=948595 RepID=L2GZJ4_VAVCU|nr:uncharacterized protein VCUG_00109 [Vavraia culicis subsp. floridensis]ELA48500.1 hypothetical protein VCUG_00109 [Vavraia culicis subsp. floridensis]